jgi:catechol 2,3-dioxygenase-like lactoylglutathione lyase family enzyme
MAGITGFHHLALTVRDLEKSVGWYSELLGLNKIRELPDEGRGAKVICLQPDCKLVIGFTQHRSNPGDGFSEFRTGMDHVAFAVSSQAELEDWQARFQERGIEHSEIKPSALGSLITFRDPDNIQLEVYAPA